MRSRLRGMAVLIGAVALVLGGCGQGGGVASLPASPADVQAGGEARASGGLLGGGPGDRAAGIEAPSTDLVPSGWALFGVPASEQSWPEWARCHMVADGEGSVWYLGPLP